MIAFDLALPRKVIFGSGRADELAALLPTLGRRVLLCTGSDPARHRGLLGDVEPVAVVPVVREPTVDDVRAATGWDLKVADDLQITPDPSGEELRLIREELDPDGVYVKA